MTKGDDSFAILISILIIVFIIYWTGSGAATTNTTTTTSTTLSRNLLTLKYLIILAEMERQVDALAQMFPNIDRQIISRDLIQTR